MVTPLMILIYYLRDLKAENVLRTADGRWVLAGEVKETYRILIVAWAI